jgi:hypothetical protein
LAIYVQIPWINPNWQQLRVETAVSDQGFESQRRLLSCYQASTISNEKRIVQLSDEAGCDHTTAGRPLTTLRGDGIEKFALHNHIKLLTSTKRVLVEQQCLLGWGTSC